MNQSLNFYSPKIFSKFRESTIKPNNIANNNPKNIYSNNVILKLNKESGNA